jgi:hypothetical protein
MNRVVTSDKEKANELRCTGFANMGQLADRVEKGERFSREQLLGMGYDFFLARNISHFLATGEVISLYWE